MITVFETVDFVLPSEKSRQIDCKVICLTSRITQIYAIITFAQFLAKSLRILSLPLTSVDWGSMDEFLSLVCDYLDDGGMGMST